MIVLLLLAVLILIRKAWNRKKSEQAVVQEG